MLNDLINWARRQLDYYQRYQIAVIDIELHQDLADRRFKNIEELIKINDQQTQKLRRCHGEIEALKYVIQTQQEVMNRNLVNAINRAGSVNQTLDNTLGGNVQHPQEQPQEKIGTVNSRKN